MAAQHLPRNLAQPISG